MRFLSDNKVHLSFWIVFLLIQSLLWFNFYQQNISLNADGVITLSIFFTAIWLWVFSKVDDTYIALLAVISLVFMGVIDETIIYQSLGQDLIWLLIAAFILTAGLTQSGLTAKFAGRIVQFAHTPRQLFYYSSTLLILSAFVIPATSGRAAFSLPIFLGLALVLKNYPRLVIGLGLLFPSVILLSAVGSYLGAGAHLITNQILAQANHATFSFLQWFLFGFPFAVVSSLLCTELILRVFTTQEDRNIKINILPQAIPDSSKALSHTHSNQQENQQNNQQRNCLLIFGFVLILWFTETWHGISTALVALFGALLMTMPRVGVVKFSAAIKTVPWSLLLFMAATLGMGVALIQTQAMEWVSGHVFNHLDKNSAYLSVTFIVIIILISLLSHLFIQSRSARSAVLIPIMIASASEFGISPSTTAFISTAAAGFCHTLTSSAKPLAMFNKVDGITIFSPQDLLKLSMYLAPLLFVLLCIFSFVIWPFMGLEILED